MAELQFVSDAPDMLLSASTSHGVWADSPARLHDFITEFTLNGYIMGAPALRVELPCETRSWETVADIPDVDVPCACPEGHFFIRYGGGSP